MTRSGDEETASRFRKERSFVIRLFEMTNAVYPITTIRATRILRTAANGDSTADRQSQDGAGGLLPVAEVETAELKDKRERRLARLVAVVDVIPVSAALHGNISRGRGFVPLAGVDLEEAAGQLAPIHRVSLGIQCGPDQPTCHVLARDLDAVGQVEINLGARPGRDPQLGGPGAGISKGIGHVSRRDDQGIIELARPEVHQREHLLELRTLERRRVDSQEKLVLPANQAPGLTVTV